jgi:nitrite reductase/ring-hydroxylating ferredoxin subunit
MNAAPPPATGASGWKPGFNEYLVGGIAALMLAGILIVIALYTIPSERLQLPELQPAYRVAREADFPVGTSRLVNWGDRVILVVRTDQQSYVALQGTAPNDGCILRWDAPSLRVESPCSYLVYDLHGNVVRGLTTVPLLRYAVYVRDGNVFVTRS